jgi:SAM-dependent methyltransferase
VYDRVMHPPVIDWVQSTFDIWRRGKDGPYNILEIGSLDINGSVRPIFEDHKRTYIGIDPQDGPGVDIVADAATFDISVAFDVIVCAEVFEHTEVWREIMSNAYRLLKSEGLFTATMAGVGRSPHSAIDENPIRDWEWYENITEEAMTMALTDQGWADFGINTQGLDLRVWAHKG